MARIFRLKDLSDIKLGTRMIDSELSFLKPKMEKVIEHFKTELNQFHIGRANPTLVENVEVSCYNSVMSLKQLATISSPEPQIILINPWDKSIIAEIEKAVGNSGLGLSCSDDGNVIRISVPQLTEERRNELFRLIKDKSEESHVSLRNLRREVLEKFEQAKEKGEISEDDFYRGKEELDKITLKFNYEINSFLETKEKEIKEI